jgi:hypothetical protein
MTWISPLMVAVWFAMPGTAFAQEAVPPPLAPAELAYETFCKKEEPVRKKLFRAATKEQKSAMTRAQIERWREANRGRLTKEQLAALQELSDMATPAMFDATSEARRTMASFEARADSVFSGREMDELSPYGPCVSKKPAKVTVGSATGGFRL